MAVTRYVVGVDQAQPDGKPYLLSTTGQLRESLLDATSYAEDWSFTQTERNAARRRDRACGKPDDAEDDDNNDDDDDDDCLFPGPLSTHDAKLHWMHNASELHLALAIENADVGPDHDGLPEDAGLSKILYQCCPDVVSVQIVVDRNDVDRLLQRLRPWRSGGTATDGDGDGDGSAGCGGSSGGAVVDADRLLASPDLRDDAPRGRGDADVESNGKDNNHIDEDGRLVRLREWLKDEENTPAMTSVNSGEEGLSDERRSRIPDMAEHDPNLVLLACRRGVPKGTSTKRLLDDMLDSLGLGGDGTSVGLRASLPRTPQAVDLPDLPDTVGGMAHFPEHNTGSSSPPDSTTSRHPPPTAVAFTLKAVEGNTKYLYRVQEVMFHSQNQSILQRWFYERCTKWHIFNATSLPSKNPFLADLAAKERQSNGRIMYLTVPKVKSPQPLQVHEVSDDTVHVFWLPAAFARLHQRIEHHCLRGEEETESIKWRVRMGISNSNREHRVPAADLMLRMFYQEFDCYIKPLKQATGLTPNTWEMKLCLMLALTDVMRMETFWMSNNSYPGNKAKEFIKAMAEYWRKSILVKDNETLCLGRPDDPPQTRDASRTALYTLLDRYEDEFREVSEEHHFNCIPCRRKRKASGRKRSHNH